MLVLLFVGNNCHHCTCCSHPTRFMATVPHIVVSWLPPRYLGGGMITFIYGEQGYMHLRPDTVKKQLSFATGRQEHSSAIHDEAR